MENELSTEEIVERLKDRFSPEEIRTSVSECEKLKEEGMLFTREMCIRDSYQGDPCS